VRKLAKPGELVLLSAADPLNLVGILTPQSRIPAVHRNRVLLQDGLPIAALEGGEVRRLADSSLEEGQLKTLLARRSLRHALEPHLRTAVQGEVAGLERMRDRVRNLHWSQARR